MPEKVYITLSQKDIDETDTFVYPESNGALAEDTPYWITVSGNTISVVVKSASGDIDKSFSIDDGQLSSSIEPFCKQLKIRNVSSAVYIS